MDGRGRFTGRGHRKGYSNLEAHDSPLSSSSHGPLSAQQQQAMRVQAAAQGPQRAPPTHGPSTSSRNPFSDPLRGTGSSVDHHGAKAVATGAVGSGYGPYTSVPAGSTSSFGRQSRSASRDPSPQPRYRQESPGPHSAASSAPSSPDMKRKQQGPSPLLKAQAVFTARDAIIDARLHDMSGKDDYDNPTFYLFSSRGWLNGLAVLILFGALLFLFAGYPIYTWARSLKPSTFGAYNIGGINSTGQVPKIDGLPSLIDANTPASALTRTGYDGKKYNLMFSDEFEVDGRTFWPGDDPFWEAMDFHYWPTADLEWYDPDAITTKDGKLVITMTQEPIHGLNFRSGMLQSWNKFCFTNGYIEVSIRLPGKHDVSGLWPGAWTLGNLGRAGYGATTDGVWPYSYGSCDVGTLPNQTNVDGDGPAAALDTGLRDYGGQLSLLPGQKMSACTCPGDSDEHPGPSVKVGRGAPEIDIIEAQISWTGSRLTGSVSQSAQFAPYDAAYEFVNSTPSTTIYDEDITYINDYKGGPFQQAVSVVSYTDPDSYELDQSTFSTYGWESYSGSSPAGSDGYVTWVSDGKPSWRMAASAVGPNAETGVGQRLVSQEPMYIILNLGMSDSFQTINWRELEFPAQMLVDYVRVYQLEDEPNIGCDPPEMPTSDYINSHLDAYTNPNFTTWAQAGYKKPRNSMQGC